MMHLKNNQLGQIFTPDYVAEFMVKNLKKYYSVIHNIENFDNVKVLEPCAGKGIFLKYLLREGFTNITAYELDKSIKPFLLKKFPNMKFKFENFLGADPGDKFDIIIGNPPYLGQNYNAEFFQDLVKEHPICQKFFIGNMDLFYFFIHLGIIKLNPGALLSYITTNYWITKSERTGIKKLKPHIKNECFLLEYIDLSKLQIFEKATGQHNCIFTLQKKSKAEVQNKTDKSINIIQIGKSYNTNRNKNNSFEFIFNQIPLESRVPNIIKYKSALSNNDLSLTNSWNVIFPIETAELIKKIENQCKVDNDITYLKDYFIIRNGLILIQDEIFILKEDVNIKVKGNDIYIKVQDGFIKINEKEKARLKKIYKSNAIIPYNYKKDKLSGFLIYFNKEEFNNQDLTVRNKKITLKYPNLIKYLNQFKDQLEQILINAKENVFDIYFPRRGSFIIQYNQSNKRQLTNLERYYDKFPKIIFKYISNSNTFGYTTESYYATSDTYFIWPRNMEQKLDYLFLIAYLNSKLVKFLFIAKNMFIKRSKTKLEDNLPLPNLNQYHGITDKNTINLIRSLTRLILKMQNGEDINNFTERVVELEQLGEVLKKDILSQFKENKKNLDVDFIQKIIDSLFFKLFNVEEKQIDDLIKKYYKF
ncbi:MAG: hypothetical protein EAX89_01415 [Candidatus Lokiarchaeota archaeon]|nr:hypothetical protein [Candidatus Lokiarchaeota archaeon]